MTTYEELLERDANWALLEGSMHFENESGVHKTLRSITKRLDELNIDYALVDGMAMFFHGFRRFTEVVDLLVTREGLERIHQELEGLGYVRLFAGSKALRDAETRVKIDFLVAGDYPGDDQPGPVAFPDPTEAVVDLDGLKLIEVAKLIELKLASGQATNRIKDLGDVQELISRMKLPLELKNKIDVSLQPQYERFWHEAQKSKSEEY